ncbi:DEAH-box ATP-dependent helicase HrpB [Azotobacter vinelandii CA]|uniref:DEAH-box ATP-dependent helicase HrpB n=2 Tax=Azotobacter vinelandii TaxID=354 RepID=C1DNL5_AZOVD|nr:ATP-dependent helicase HrpB [Azotobacter vinelandii]ACO77231.1 DEAH-box ATP-dependent helicase HrpB [Azotobacter vinelandii DJ]AGK13608.1 DEAH-box ATP-dependent helicase HrpB [Azotobacter vinelandii CA]AGK18105.1 DEAH-box ATP-dependent helicase HrpB [Azotobacter vinelandii CA6]SFX63824.1 ATP-dependent helicase HrpB [Azotobacter vinelandii]GLK59828.1 ATP-dependent helicase HrpB [Azotobacter vinelandii]
MNPLPIDAVLPALREALSLRHEAVLEAPPGAGKTTRVPLALLDEPWLEGQRILMLEPRRLAARAAAERLAAELGETVGETVGYRIRLDSRVGPRTRIEVVTEGILTRRLQDDPALEGVGLVIFDEFHERSLDADLALALTLNGRALLRDTPLRVLPMSATLEGERLAALLDDAPLVRSEGRMYPVEIRWGRPLPPGERIEPRLLQTVLQALEDESGSLLVFLPGQAEIRRLHEQLGEVLAGRAGILLCPLHGELDLAAQRAAIEPAPAGTRKVVLATNIAETSLTIDGVRVVVDAGLARVPRFDPGSGMTRLDTQRISRASATQRAGRAGRLEPGVCYRLWSQAQHEQLPAHDDAEILQADLAGLALQLARWGVEPAELAWLDAPPAAAFAQARELLARLGALAPNGSLSAHGQAMAGLPAHPRIAHLLLRGQALGLGDLACDVAALLGERDILRGAGADLHSRLALLGGTERAGRGARGGMQRARQLARQYRGLLPKGGQEAVADPAHPRWLGALLAFAYPDRIACQRRPGGGEYRLANGRAALFAEPDALMKHAWLVVAELGSRQGQREERIYLAAELDPALFETVLAEQVSVRDELDWDEREGVLRAERQRRVGELVLERRALPGLDEAARGRALLGLVRRKGLELLPWTPELRQWQARVALLRRLDLAEKGESDWPDLSGAALLASLEDWLAPYLGQVSRLSHFAALDLPGILRGLLPWPLPQRLDELAPPAIAVPSGSRIRLDYAEEPPVLAVRLQELFGLAQTPRIAGGRLAVKLHLLSPARRPVQVTQDLASFWANTYAEVKKDLKGRYPKHYWPDDPLIAEPTARARPRQ